MKSLPAVKGDNWALGAALGFAVAVVVGSSEASSSRPRCSVSRAFAASEGRAEASAVSDGAARHETSSDVAIPKAKRQRFGILTPHQSTSKPIAVAGVLNHYRRG